MKYCPLILGTYLLYKYYAEQVQGEVIDETLEEDAENKKKKKHTIYIREQMNNVVEIDFNLMGRSKQIPLESNGNIYIYVMKMQLDNGYKMVSVYLHNNDKSDGDEKEYAKVMFQVEMLIADDLMSPIFVPEYLCRKVELEDEYYYKGRPVYARGRGCAATWEKKAEEINATAIKSSFIPDYEIPSVSAQIDDMPEHAFSMLQMGSPKKKSEVIQNLRTLTEMYGSWITDALTNDEAMHDDKFKASINLLNIIRDIERHTYRRRLLKTTFYSILWFLFFKNSCLQSFSISIEILFCKLYIIVIFIFRYICISRIQ